MAKKTVLHNKVSILGLTLLFLLLYFFINNHYYVPSKIAIETSAVSGTSASLFWDTGAGFNEREKVTFTPYLPSDFENKQHIVEITRLDEFNPNSKGSEVWVEQIDFGSNGNNDLVSLFNTDKAFINGNNKFAIRNTSTTIKFQKKFEKLDIAFYTHPWAGKAQVSIDGKSRVIDLYSTQAKSEKISFDGGALPGNVVHEFPLPQLKINAFNVISSDESVTIKSIKVISDQATVNIPVEDIKSTLHVFTNLDLKTAKFNIILFVVQILTALITTYFIFEVWIYIEKKYRCNGNNILRCLFFDNERYVFWLLFCISCVTFSLWLFGQWPGVMSVDSYHYTWREIKTMEFTNVTPWMYNFYVLALTQYYDSPVIIALFQVIVTSFLGSYIFYFTYKHGASRKVILMSYILFIFSIPVGLYNITLWKDIPFNTSMLFWGFLIYYLYYQKNYTKNPIEITLPRLVFLVFSLMILCTTRHNGIIFLALIPILLYKFKLFNKRNFYQFTIITICMYTMIAVVSPIISTSNADEVKAFFAKTYKVAPLAAIYSSNNFYSPAREKDKAVINKWLTTEELKNKYSPVMQADAVGYMVSQWQKLNPEEQDYLNYLYYARVPQNFHIFLADRTAMFMGTLGFSANVFTHTNEMTSSLDKSFWRPIEAYKFTPTPKSQLLYTVEDFVIRASKSFRGEIPVSMIIFNAFPALMIFCGVLFLHHKYPASALYSFIFLFNLPFLFIALSTCEWRYTYFLLLACYFIFPIMSVEKKSRKKVSDIIG